MNRTGQRLLFLSYFFPPVREIAAVRTGNIAKQLVARGWQVQVVTPRPELWLHTDRDAAAALAASGPSLQCLTTDHRWRSLAAGIIASRGRSTGRLVAAVCRRAAQRLGIDPFIGWASCAERACEAVREGDVDLILASGPPFSAFAIALHLSERLRVPYVLDYRDLWTAGNPFAPRSPGRRAAALEERVVRQAAAITSVSPSSAEVIGTRFGTHTKVQVITNGYDPEGLATVEPTAFDDFALVYAGRLYPPRRVLRPVFRALSALVAENWRFHYYGPSARHVAAEAAEAQVTNRVVLHGNVPRREALAAIKGAGVTVIVNTIGTKASRSEHGVVPGKLFETLGLGSPVLLVAAPGGDAERIVGSSGLGQSFNGEDIEGIRAYLLRLMGGWRPQPHAMQSYGWPHLGQRFHELLLTATQAGPGSSEVVEAWS